MKQLASLLLLVAGRALAAQAALDVGPQAASRAFLASARGATARYRDPQAAVADGYRVIGPDFPGMGEHWIHPGLLVSGRLDVAHPQILEYASVAGRPTLVGVAYAAVVRDSEVPTAFPVAPNAWHFHSGTVDEESFVLSHAGAGHDHGAGPWLAVLHAWVWLENPAGPFAADNWALPYARLGLTPPRDAPVAAAKALSLATGGDAYFGTLLRALGQPDSVDARAMRAVVARYRIAVQERVTRRNGSQDLAGEEIASLSQAWRSLCAALDTAVSNQVAQRLRPIRDP